MLLTWFLTSPLQNPNNPPKKKHIHLGVQLKQKNTNHRTEPTSHQPPSLNPTSSICQHRILKPTICVNYKGHHCRLGVYRKVAKMLWFFGNASREKTQKWWVFLAMKVEVLFCVTMRSTELKMSNGKRSLTNYSFSKSQWSHQESAKNLEEDPAPLKHVWNIFERVHGHLRIFFLQRAAIWNQ